MSNSCWQLVNPPSTTGRETEDGGTGRGEGGGRERGKEREGGVERARERYVERERERLKDKNKILFLDGQVARPVGHLHRCLNLHFLSCLCLL